MIVINPNNVTHTIYLIPRRDADTVTYTFKNQQDQAETTDSSSTQYANGIINFDVELMCSEGDKFHLEVFDEVGLIYRGNVFATAQEDLENYQVNPDLIRY